MTPSIVAIGTFDGLHLGHRHLIDQLLRLAQSHSLTPAVLTFDRHPRDIVRPHSHTPLITSPAHRDSLIRQAGVTHILTLPFTAEIAALSALQFAERILITRLDTRAILLGHDNRFGSDRLSSPDAYSRALAPAGISVFAASPFSLPDGRTPSSSAIRSALEAGDIATANTMLGRPYTISGTVVHGSRVGRTIGFPTANIALPSPVLLPAPGVYAATLAPDDTPVMLNIGTAPTVHPDRKTATIEAHIITDRSPDLYGRSITVAPVARIRDERTFPNIDALTQALRHDRDTTLKLLSN